MFLRHTTDDENDVGTWERGHGFYFLRRRHVLAHIIRK